MKFICLSLVGLLCGGCTNNKNDNTADTTTAPSSTGEDTAEVEAPAVPDKVLSPGLTTLWITQEIDGVEVEREVLIDAPDTFASDIYPVVFAFHGAEGMNDKFVTQMEHLVQTDAFVGVYPQGHDGFWALGVEPSSADDVAFIDAIVAELSLMDRIDVDRVYAIGTSNGAGLAHRVAIQTRHFRAFVAMSTALTVSPVPDSTTHPVSVLQIMGMLDGLCPYDGGETAIGHTFMPAEDSVATWASAIGCSGEGTLDIEPNGDRRLHWNDCPGDREVMGIGLGTVGHGIPADYEGNLMSFAWSFLRTH